MNTEYLIMNNTNKKSAHFRERIFVCAYNLFLSKIEMRNKLEFIALLEILKTTFLQ